MKDDRRDPWAKLQDLIASVDTPATIDEAEGRTIGEVLKKGNPEHVAAVLKKDAGFSMEELGKIFADLEKIADRNSIRWWSPLA